MNANSTETPALRFWTSMIAVVIFCALAVGSTETTNSSSSSSLGSSGGDCAYSCAAHNNNESGHDWVARFGDGAGYQEYSRCLDEAVARSTTAAAMNCTSRGNRACASACRSAGAGR
jgi:hypothetical protein